MKKKRETGRLPRGGATVTTVIAVTGASNEILLAGERLTCLWYTSHGKRHTATLRRHSDGRVFHGVPVELLDWEEE